MNQLSNKWLCINDALPPNMNYVFVTNGTAVGRAQFIRETLTKRGKVKYPSQWFVNTALLGRRLEELEITHWMPLSSLAELLGVHNVDREIKNNND